MYDGDVDFESLTPDDFPRWKDRSCPHAESRQAKDDMGTVCMDCGAVLVQWR